MACVTKAWVGLRSRDGIYLGRVWLGSGPGRGESRGERESIRCVRRVGVGLSVSLPMNGETTEWQRVDSLGLRSGDGIYLGCGLAVGRGGWG